MATVKNWQRYGLIQPIEVEKGGETYLVLCDYQGLFADSREQMLEFIEELQRSVDNLSNDEITSINKHALLERNPAMFRGIYGEYDSLWQEYLKTHPHEAPPIPKPTPRKALKGFVYVIQGGEHFKIGYTKSLTERVRALGIKAPFSMKVCILIPTMDMRQTEAELHKRYGTLHTNGEWFALTEQDLQDIQQDYETIDPKHLLAD